MGPPVRVDFDQRAGRVAAPVALACEVLAGAEVDAAGCTLSLLQLGDLRGFCQLGPLNRLCDSG